jgi:hypothetical protein
MTEEEQLALIEEATDELVEEGIFRVARIDETLGRSMS